MSLSDPLVARLIDRLTEAFRAPSGLRGTVQLRVTDAPLADTWVHIEDETLVAGEGSADTADAVVQMSRRGLADILDNPSLVDFRYLPWSILATASGDVRLAILVGRLLKRPEPAVAERFPAVEAAARANPVSGVRRLHRPTADVVVETLRGGIPLVLTGLLDTWPISTPTAWIERFGHVKLAGQRKGTSFGDFVQGALETSTVSSAGCTLPEAMWSAFPFPLFDAASYAPRQLWAGAARVDRPITKLHRDLQHAFLGHLFGRKRLRIFSPDQRDLLYPSEGYNSYQPCRAEPGHSDLRVFPRLADAVPLEIVLSPGELLIIPIGWFHQVFADDPVFSVSAFLKFEAWQALATTA